jgi:hypothetical protein
MKKKQHDVVLSEQLSNLVSLKSPSQDDIFNIITLCLTLEGLTDQGYSHIVEKYKDSISDFPNEKKLSIQAASYFAHDEKTIAILKAAGIDVDHSAHFTTLYGDITDIYCDDTDYESSDFENQDHCSYASDVPHFFCHPIHYH